ncbi:recombinase family protein [Ectopseudomonas mendocina]|uniref:recombinase family protein n=1 Tax=Ectopseudomonas mendocina TaxID=300 RepID=UPI000206DABE|nr:recombinase family protein [Pseudomonas mendocina]AEB59101.1 resolvase domain-containing protein [Pseudomonas mendocina NK-01]
MMIRAYLRASTAEQDAGRAKEQLKEFAEQHGHRVAGYYVENESGATLQRPELFRLLADSEAGDVLLVEQVDRLARLNESDWSKLRGELQAKGVLVVALDLPTSHQAMQSARVGDDFTSRMLGAINTMLLDMLAAVARKDYDDRRRRQAQGIEKAKAQGAYKGRQVDAGLHCKIAELLADGKSVRGIAELLGCSTNTVQRVKKGPTA